MGASTKSRDVYEDVTNRIVQAIEEGTEGFQMPWYQGGVTGRRPTNAATSNGYRGVNVVALWTAELAHGWSSGYWATYKQWQSLGAQVRRGEKASIVVFYKRSVKEILDKETGTSEARTYFLARASCVFNGEQVDGWEAPPLPMENKVQPLAKADALIAASRADIRHGSDVAYYHPLRDCIHIPDRERFTGTKTSTATESYYAVLLHELTHWTGHRDRTGRDMVGRFGDNAYAMEELVAELGSAFLCADLGVTNVPREDHSSYIANWLEVLRHDKRAIFTAARKAEEASEYIRTLGEVDDGVEVASNA